MERIALKDGDRVRVNVSGYTKFKSIDGYISHGCIFKESNRNKKNIKELVPLQNVFYNGEVKMISEIDISCEDFCILL